MVRALRGALGLVLIGMLAAWREHPVHASRMELHVASGVVTGTIHVFREDFPPGLNPEAIIRYLERTVRLVDPSGVRVPLTPARVSAEGDRLRIVMRGKTSQPLGGGQLHVSLMHEQFADQINVVDAEIAGRQKHLIFLLGDPAQALP